MSPRRRARLRVTLTTIAVLALTAAALWAELHPGRALACIAGASVLLLGVVALDPDEAISRRGEWR